MHRIRRALDPAIAEPREHLLPPDAPRGGERDRCNADLYPWSCHAARVPAYPDGEGANNLPMESRRANEDEPFLAHRTTGLNATGLSRKGVKPPIERRSAHSAALPTAWARGAHGSGMVHARGARSARRLDP